MAKHAKDVDSSVIKLELAATRAQGLNITLFDVAAAFKRTRPIGRKNSKHGMPRLAK